MQHKHGGVGQVHAALDQPAGRVDTAKQDGDRDDGTNSSGKVAITKLRLARAESPEAENYSLPLRATTLTNTAPVAASGLWRARKATRMPV